MSKIFKQSDEVYKGYHYPNDRKPELVRFYYNSNMEYVSSVLLDDSSEIEGACINCSEVYCIERTPPEGVYDSLRLSQSDVLCPVGAISDEGGYPYISEDVCVSCGLCAARCPVGGISINEGKAIIKRPPDEYVLSEERISLKEVDVLTVHEEPAEYSGRVESFLAQIRESKSGSAIYKDLVVKALCMAGIPTYKARQGDVNLRMDALGKVSDTFYAVEILDAASLDGPRDILDDIAVFCARNRVSKDNVLGLIVLAELPNKRTEYWQLITDIYKVLGVRIATLPLAALLSAVWNQKHLDLSEFLLDESNYSARMGINKILERDINIEERSSLLEAAK